MMNMEIFTISIKEPDISNHPQTGEFFSGLFCYFPEKHCILSLYLIQNRIVIENCGIGIQGPLRSTDRKAERHI